MSLHVFSVNVDLEFHVYTSFTLEIQRNLIERKRITAREVYIKQRNWLYQTIGTKITKDMKLQKITDN